MMKRFTLLCSIASGVAAADSTSIDAHLIHARDLLAANNFAAACSRLEAARDVDPTHQQLKDRLFDCYDAHATALRPTRDDAKTCERIEGIERASPSETNKATLAICYKAHAWALMRLEDYDHACPRAEASVRVTASAKNKAFAAECYQRWSKLGRAWRLLVDALETARADNQPEVEKPIVERLATLVPGPGRAILRIPAGAVATIDAQPIAASGLAIAGAPPAKDAFNTEGFALDSGKHVVRVTAPDKPELERTIHIVDGRTEIVTIDWPASPAPVVRVASSRKIIGWITIAASGALGAAGFYFGYDALSKQTDADDLCPTGTNCSTAAIDLNDKSNRSANISNVMVGAALVGAAVGAYLVLTAPNEPRVIPTAGPGAVGLMITRGF